jgi:hypothetical protein
LANKINTVEITCTPAESRCDLHQANVMGLGEWQAYPPAGTQHAVHRPARL